MDELDKNQLQLLKNAFDAFDHEKKGVISTDMVGTILEMLGHELDEDTLKEIIQEIDQDEVIGAFLGTNRRQKKKVEKKGVKTEAKATTDKTEKGSGEAGATKKETEGSPPETKPSTSTVPSASNSCSSKVVMTL